MRFRSVFIVLAVTVCFLMAGATAQARTYEWVAGGMGGGWYTMAAGIAELVKEKAPDIEIKVIPGAGTQNPIRISKGMSDIGWGITPFTFAAYHGRPPYKKAYKNLRTLGVSFSNSQLHFGAAAETGVKSVAEIFRKKMPIRIGVTKVGSSDENAFRLVMKYYGASYKDIKEWGGRYFHNNYQGIVNLFKDRQIDFFFVNLAYPASAVVDMAMSRKIRLLPFEPGLTKYLNEEYGFGTGAMATIPKGAYKFLKEDVVTSGMGSVIMVTDEFPEKDAYRIIKILSENTDRLVQIHKSMAVFDPRVGWKDTGAPLHPGAERYYREMGYLK